MKDAGTGVGTWRSRKGGAVASLRAGNALLLVIVGFCSRLNLTQHISPPLTQHIPPPLSPRPPTKPQPPARHRLPTAARGEVGTERLLIGSRLPPLATKPQLGGGSPEPWPLPPAYRHRWPPISTRRRLWPPLPRRISSSSPPLNPRRWPPPPPRRLGSSPRRWPPISTRRRLWSPPPACSAVVVVVDLLAADAPAHQGSDFCRGFPLQPVQREATNPAKIIEEFQKCHLDHPIKKLFGECTELKIKLDRCFRQEKAIKRKANFEESKKFRERLQASRKEMAETGP